MQHGAVKVPSSEEVKDTLYELLKGDERPDLDDIDEIQRVGRYKSLAHCGHYHPCGARRIIMSMQHM